MVCFLQEAQKYEKTELQLLVGTDLINELLKESICKKVDSEHYQLNFVGLVAYKDVVVSLLPKYSRFGDEAIKLADTITLVKVLKKYEKSRTKEIDSDFFPLQEGAATSNILGLMDYFLKDFIYQGYYEREIEEIIDDGEDYISWEDTIAEISPYFVNKRPYYLNTKNVEYKNDESSIVTAIHQYIIFECHKRYGKILGYELTNVITPYANLESLGDTSFLLNVIRRELQSAYNDRSIKLLQAMAAYISNNYATHNKVLNLFGTKDFEYIWEKVCSTIFNNQKKQYKNKIPTAKWENYYNLSTSDSAPLDPDILSEHESEKDNFFLILDAKYYNITPTKKGFVRTPGINDIAKQHLYEMIFKAHFENHNIVNALLFPNDKIEDTYEIFGRVNLEFLSQNPISLVYINAKIAYDLYLMDYFLNENIMTTLCNELADTKLKKKISNLETEHISLLI